MLETSFEGGNQNQNELNRVHLIVTIWRAQGAEHFEQDLALR
jgi:hypothetical protein